MVNTMKIEKALNEKSDASKNEEKVLVEKKKESSETVSVCCGVPMGQRFFLNDGTVVKLNGVPMSHIVSAEKGNAYLPAGKYGVTTILKSQWEEILARWGKCDLITNGIIFAEKDTDSAQAKGSELKDKKLGFEQADPKKGRTKKKSDED